MESEDYKGTATANRGYTLIEIIIALTILAVGMVSAMSYLPVALDSSKKVSDLNKAAMIAKSLLEQIKADSFDAITKADSFDTNGEYKTYTDYPGFRYKITVSSELNGQMRLIGIGVSWKFKGKDMFKDFQVKIVKYNPG